MSHFSRLVRQRMADIQFAGLPDEEKERRTAILSLLLWGHEYRERLDAESKILQSVPAEELVG